MQNNNNSNNDLFGEALLDYFHGSYTDELITHLTTDKNNLLPLPYMFRTYDQMPVLEQTALTLCRGNILDVGCGAGSHALYLQDSGLEVTGIDISAGAIETCRLRGVKDLVNMDFMDYSGTKFDTILLLMHGIGMAANLKGLEAFLNHAKSLLNEGGQILLDSSDIIYMFEVDDDGGYWVPADVSYYGEVQFITEYKGNKTEPFPWLYVDYDRLKAASELNNLHCELIRKGDHYDYLARIMENS